MYFSASNYTNGTELWKYDGITGPAAAISTSTLPTTSFAPGAAVSVSFAYTGTFNAGNIFTAQLSNAFGSFATPVNIGSRATIPINAIIPANTPAGTGYRIRVVGSNPATIGTDNGTNLTICTPPAAPTVTPAARCGTGTLTLTAAGGSAGNYRWYAAATGGTALANATGATFTTPSLTVTTTYYVTIMNGTCESTRTPVTATINTCTGMPESELAAQLQIYPNPTTDKLQIRLPVPARTSVTLKILDATGRVKISRQLETTGSEWHHTLSLGKLAKGMYQLQLILNQETIARRIVVE